MKNHEIVKILEDISGLLELKGENIFKARAYQKAARSIEFLSEEVEKLVKENRLREVPGIGEAIEKKLTELVQTGHMEYYEKLRSEFPEGIGTFLDIPGIGPHTALLLTRDLGVTNVDELERAIQNGRVAALPRMGEKTAQKILHQIQAYRKKKSEQRIPLGTALPVAESIIAGLGKVGGLRNLTPAGSLRRFKETIGDIDLIGTADDAEEVIRAFTTLPQIKEMLERGSTKASAIVMDGLQVDLRLVDHESFGSALQHSTGSKQHNVDLRTRAERLGLSLSEYGITEVETGKLEKFKTEEAFYKRQGLQYIPPEIREGTHEIELAEKNTLPDLIELSDIRGDLHVHTDASDGEESLESVVAAAVKKGYQYLAITDHSVGLGIAKGLDIERLRQQVRQIKALNRKFSAIHLLTGAEVDIRTDGSLDIPDEVLGELDVVLGSIHLGMGQNEEMMTQRIIKAIENPHIDVIAHLTGRLLGEREPVAINLEAVFKAAAKHRTAVEINAMPTRLDLKDTHISQAREMGVKLIISTDAHQARHLDYMRFGVGTARRGWCRRSDILNTLSFEKFVAWLSR